MRVPTAPRTSGTRTWGRTGSITGARLPRPVPAGWPPRGTPRHMGPEAGLTTPGTAPRPATAGPPGATTTRPPTVVPHTTGTIGRWTGWFATPTPRLVSTEPNDPG